MPAAAVIPAPIAYIKVAAVKKLVVGFLVCNAWPAVLRRVCAGAFEPSFWNTYLQFILCGMRTRSFTLKKLECLKQAFALNTLAWNNNLGLASYFVGF